MNSIKTLNSINIPKIEASEYLQKEKGGYLTLNYEEKEENKRLYFELDVSKCKIIEGDKMDRLCVYLTDENLSSFLKLEDRIKELVEIHKDKFTGFESLKDILYTPEGKRPRLILPIMKSARFLNLDDSKNVAVAKSSDYKDTIMTAVVVFNLSSLYYNEATKTIFPQVNLTTVAVKSSETTLIIPTF